MKALECAAWPTTLGNGLCACACHRRCGLACATEIGNEIREYYGIDESGAELRAALGLPERSPVELVGRLRAAPLRTKPDFVLLNADEGCAYDRLGPDGPPLWETVLAAGRADLARLREGDHTAWREVAEDPVRRRLTLRAAQFDAPRATWSCCGTCCGTRHGPR